uniref:Uncharacterized protein n=1 Tax=Rhizophora mucronata TaxID=61149 RepID=A0A2P2MXG4_RHIMU
MGKRQRASCHPDKAQSLRSDMGYQRKDSEGLTHT